MAVQSIPVGTTFGRLTVIGEAEPRIDKHGWKRGVSIVRCECGTEKTVINGKLLSRWTVSCGCLSSEKSAERCRLRTTHGKTKTNEHRIWASMNSRCRDVNSPAYKDYGGRGINVCERWQQSFEAFLEDMGPRPSNKHSIDRINNDGNYEPNNCRWATRVEQANNMRTNRLFTFYGKTMTLTQWAEISLVNRRTIMVRLKRGWTEKAAFWTPVKR